MGEASDDNEHVLAEDGAADTSDGGVPDEDGVGSMNGRAVINNEFDSLDGFSSSVEGTRADVLPSSPATAIVALAVLGIPVIALGVRAICNLRGRSERATIRAAHCLMVDVDEGMVRTAASNAPDGEQTLLRVSLSPNLFRMPWDDDGHLKVVGTSKASTSSIQGLRKELRGVWRPLLRRSRAWCGLVNPTGVIAVELGIVDCACVSCDAGKYSPWSSIAARGLFGYRCSSGQAPTGLVIAARKGAALLTCGNALMQTSGRRVSQDDSPRRYLVAEDVFGVCEKTMVGVTPSVIEGVKRWAGTEQAQSLSLCQWLYHRVSSLRRFIPARVDGDGKGKPTTGDVLDALVLVQNALRFGPETLNDASASNAADLGQGAAVHPAAIAAAEDHIHAKLVAEELSKACYAAMDEGLVFVVPTSPGPPPRIDADESDIMAWEVALTRLNSLAALAGIPQVSMPVAITPSSSSAASSSSFVGISLLTRQRHDLAILRSLEKLHGYIVRDIGERARQQKGTEGGKADAEAEKALGNACFKNKQYMQAAQHYTRCIAFDQTNPVYPSNRAMAQLKMGAYEEAERDCDLALRLDQCNVKALLRRGAARAALGSYDEAARDYARVLDIEPGNRQARDELARLRMC